MNEQEIKVILQSQKKFFREGHTLSVTYRIDALNRLKASIEAHEKELCEALYKDLGKSSDESYMTEIGQVLSEISYLLKHIRSFAKEHRVRTPLAQFAARSFKKPSPYGTVLIMSPWNYPFLLSLDPLCEAIAAGNTVVLKPSAYAPNVSAAIQSLIEESFPRSYLAVVTGGRQENTSLLNQQFDLIFFTGSQAVGKVVLEHAAQYLTPAVLELGGKSPVIIDEQVNIDLAARRIVFGKFLNCGQTCVAPDYVLCHTSVVDTFVQACEREIIKQFGKEPLYNEDYGKIINEKHFHRILNLIDPEKVYFGGHNDPFNLKIEPTILVNVDEQDAIMQEEIFGPVLPILTYDDIHRIPDWLNDRPHPLAFYVFSDNQENIHYLTEHCQFGGGCINDTIIHLATPYLGFGGVGASGMGAYHGKVGFDTFSHTKSIVDKKTWIDLPMRYQPYTKRHRSMIRRFMK
ncbi:aldehyde dehydrogenase [Catenisphaera adipataccumulans]|jgi:aldehyde dehydrogenase (NAD+)|uniref:Aldehyde dehydrogenase n=1 Tax=Catenisphaera adipataccumulans TaxID=700500 RepID=A0A7W8CWU7_9FIRM|nr:aldehyde dehydrogenase [Catenisphaera adipataccumulans]MBB5183051.1 aldehyde dehydrogenase (NAD+) [Catenisphaera adipataccumulans]